MSSSNSSEDAKVNMCLKASTSSSVTFKETHEEANTLAHWNN